ncbi:MAG: hypothetical protein Q9M50_09550 [Methylococcales bacterium]|nr:hypothetical protein [Methylococcales bacterium]
MIKRTLLNTGFILLTTSCFLYGCGDSDSKKTQTSVKTVKIFKQAKILKGLVSDDKGRIKAGKISAINDKKKVIATASVQEDGYYKIEIPALTVLPILLKVSLANDKAENKELTAAIIYTSMTKFDINPLSTKIAEKAKKLGGYTHSNMVVAAESMVKIPDDNKSTRGFRGDPTKQYGGWH